MKELEPFGLDVHVEESVDQKVQVKLIPARN